MSEKTPSSGSPIAVRPLSVGRALILYAVLYPAAVVCYANLSPGAVSDLRNYWPVFLVIGLPILLIILRMLWNLLVAPWFSISLALGAAGIAAAAAITHPVDAAFTLVYRRPAFVLLLASLVAGLLASVVASPWNRRHLPRIVFQIGLLIALTGAFLAIAQRIGGLMPLSKGQTDGTLSLGDYCVTLVSEDGKWTTIPVRLEAAKSGAYTQSAQAGPLRIDMEYAAPSEGAPAARVQLTASDGNASAKCALAYAGGFVPVQVGSAKYRAAFGPSEVVLPFEITLDYAGEDTVAGSGGKAYDAAVSLSERNSGQLLKVGLATGSAFTAFGYEVALVSVDRPAGATLAVRKNAGRSIFYSGIAVSILGLGLAFWTRRGPG